MQELPGRLWEGKENVLEAIGSLVTAEPAAFNSPDVLIAALLGAHMLWQQMSTMQSCIPLICTSHDPDK